MALVVNDRVKETSTTTGTGTLTLDGAVTGFETFSSAIGNTNTTYYAIELPNTAEFEVGLGTVAAGTLARTTVISSSNSDALVNFSAGTKNVFCTLPASKAVIKDASDNVIFGDNEKANFGDGNDLQIYHDGSLSYIVDSGTGDLRIESNFLRLVDRDNNATTATFDSSGVNLRHNDAVKLTTTSTGATVTGNLTATGNLTVTSDSSSNGIFLKGRSSDDIGTLKFLSNSGASSQLEISSRPTVGIFNHPTDTSFRINNTEVFGLDSSAVKVNETGADVDFIVESVNNANMLHVNAGNDKVGIGGVPSEKLSVIGSNNTSAATLKVKDTDGRGILISSPYSGSGVGFIGTDGTNSSLGFKVNGTEYARLGTNGYLGIGTSSPSTLLHLSSSDPQITITDTDGTGSQVIKAQTDNLRFETPNLFILQADNAGSIQLYDSSTYYGKIFRSSGFKIESVVADQDIFLRGNDGGSFIDALSLDMSEAGAATFNSSVTVGGNLDLADNNRARFGDGNDLQIYHDGGNSWIKDVGTGNLNILGSDEVRIGNLNNELFFVGNNNGSVDLYYDNAKKLETTSTGIDVTGTAVTDGLTVAGNVSVDGGTIKLDGNYPTGTNNVALGNTALDSITTGNQNTAIGANALTAITTQSDATAIGYNAASSTTGGNNTAIGSSALNANVSGTNNTVIGKGAARQATSNNNTAVGHEALDSQTGGYNNTAVGQSAGSTITSGNNLTVLGYNAEPSAATATNEITLGDANVTSLRIPGLTSGASSGDVLTYDGTDIGFSTPTTGIAAVVDDTTPQLGGTLDTNSNLILFGDSSGGLVNRLKFGTGGDLELFHNSFNSYIRHGGTGDLNIEGDDVRLGKHNTTETYLKGIADGAVEVYYDNNKKLETTSTGIDVTGTAVVDGLTVAGNVSVDSGTIKLDGGFPTGTANTCYGEQAGQSITSTANLNTFVGYHAGDAVTTGDNNTALGVDALTTETTGSGNTCLGRGAASLMNGGFNSVFIGNTAGGDARTNNNVICIGRNAEPSSGSSTNEITLGDTNITSLRIPGLQSGASSGDVLTYDGTDITLSAPTGVSAGFSIAMAIAL